MPDADALELSAMLDSRRHAQRYVSEWETAVLHWRGWKERGRKTDKIASHEFELQWPDGGSQTEAPKTPNIVDLVLKDRSAMASSVRPSLECPAPTEDSREAAAKRSRIAATYWRVNRVQRMLPYYFRDLYTHGCNIKLVEPDMKTGYPRVRRIDPRLAWPDVAYSPDRGITNLLVGTRKTYAELAAEYDDETKAALADVLQVRNKRQPIDGMTFEVIEYYDSSELVRVAVHGKEGARNGVVLQRVDNLLDRVPVVVAALPSHDLQFRGIFDGMLSVLETENTIANLLLDASVDFVTAPVVYWNIENPRDYGKAALRAKSADAYWRRSPPDQANGQIFAILAQLRGTAREAAVFPDARSGNVDQNIASAAFVNAVLGSYSTGVAEDQRIEAASWEDVLSLCFEVDETYLDLKPDGTPWRKTIRGSRGVTKRHTETYRPSSDIGGHYETEVNYGHGAGTDEFNAEIRLYAAVQNKIMSQKRARKRSIFVDDEVENEKEILQEQILEAGMAFVQQQAAQGNFAPAAALNDALSGGQDIYLVLSQFGSIQQAQPAPPGGAPQDPAQAFRDAAALSRGAPIDSLEQDTTNVPGVGALPPLSQILVQ